MKLGVAITISLISSCAHILGNNISKQNSLVCCYVKYYSLMRRKHSNSHAIGCASLTHLHIHTLYCYVIKAARIFTCIHRAARCKLFLAATLCPSNVGYC